MDRRDDEGWLDRRGLDGPHCRGGVMNRDGCKFFIYIFYEEGINEPLPVYFHYFFMNTKLEVDHINETLLS